jgi:hypothetical protein
MFLKRYLEIIPSYSIPLKKEKKEKKREKRVRKKNKERIKGQGSQL